MMITKKRNLKKEEKTDATGWFDIKYKRGSNNKELDKEQALMLGHQVIV